MLLGGNLADARARGRGKRIAIRVAQEVPVRVDGTSERVDRPAQVVHGMAVGGAKRKTGPVDARQAGRVRARAGRVDVPAEVEGLGLLRPESRGDEAGAAHGQEQAPGPSEEASAGRASGDCLAKH